MFRVTAIPPLRSYTAINKTLLCLSKSFLSGTRVDIVSGREPAKMPPKTYPRGSLERYRMAKKSSERTIRRRRSNAAVPPRDRRAAAEGHEAGLRQGLALDQDLVLQLSAFAEAECWRTFCGAQSRIAERCARCLDSPGAATSLCRFARRRNLLFRKMRIFISENQTSCYPL